MYCTNCGAEVNNDATFCSKCGSAQSPVQTAPVASNSISSYAYYALFAISPILFLIRMATQAPKKVGGVEYSWGTWGSTTTVLAVPENIKPLMILIVAVSTLFSVATLKSLAGASKTKLIVSILMIAINIFLSIPLIFVEF